jgi:hypothetical protein
MIGGYPEKMARPRGRTIEQQWRTWCERDSEENRENRQVTPRYLPTPKAPSPPTAEHNGSEYIIIEGYPEKMATIGGQAVEHQWGT